MSLESNGSTSQNEKSVNWEFQLDIRGIKFFKEIKTYQELNLATSSEIPTPRDQRTVLAKTGNPWPSN
jgi:hypothetical protein